MPETPTAAPDQSSGAPTEPDGESTTAPDADTTGSDEGRTDDRGDTTEPFEGTPERPGDDPAAVVPVGRSAATSLLTWGTVALVLVIVVVLIILKVTGSTPTTTTNETPAPQPAPSSVIQSVTKIPAAVYDTIGVTSPDELVAAPSALHGQAALKIDAKPGVVFIGSEFCPYCAAERWSVVAALSRFGKFSLLPAAQSGSDEAFPGTPTFSFAGARYKSSYIGVRLVETYSNQKNGAGTAYSVLDKLTGVDRALLAHYDKGTAKTGKTAASVVPFVDVNNQMVVVGGSFSPAALEQLTMAQIASGLSDPKDPATQAIVAGANYLSAAICTADGGRPVAVCTSRGVEAAATALAQGS